MYAGADGTLIRAPATAGARGIVIEAAGSGNVNLEMYDAIKEAIAKGIAVVISTRVANGRVLPIYGFAHLTNTHPSVGQALTDTQAKVCHSTPGKNHPALEMDL